MDKLERLLNLTAALLDTGRPLTAQELRERIGGYPEGDGAFHRAFERDKEDLRELGIPLSLITIEGEQGLGVEAYRIDKASYFLPDPDLEPDELAALHLAASTVRMDGFTGMEALWKLGAAVPSDAPMEAVGVPEVHLPTDPRLVDLFVAIAERRSLSFEYQGATRQLDPHRLDFRHGRWILSGWDRSRDSPRRFRVDRIDGRPQPGPAEGFLPRPELLADGAVKVWEQGEEAPLEAQLRVDADYVSWARRHLGADTPARAEPDGGVVFTLRVTNRAAFRSFVLGFLDHAELLGPEDLRAELIAWLREVAETR